MIRPKKALLEARGNKSGGSFLLIGGESTTILVLWVLPGLPSLRASPVRCILTVFGNKLKETGIVVAGAMPILTLAAKIVPLLAQTRTLWTPAIIPILTDDMRLLWVPFVKGYRLFRGSSCLTEAWSLRLEVIEMQRLMDWAHGPVLDLSQTCIHNEWHCNTDVM